MQYTYLALGDSYTIGEQVPIYESFPYQLVQRLRKRNVLFHAPEIVAKTGWTTDELRAGIAAQTFLPRYDLVTLLIGVNNQYRGRSVEDFIPEFKGLLEAALAFAGNRSERVYVLSIPDWGIMPFATGMDRQKIAAEIDAYNQVCKETAAAAGVCFIDNTQALRSDAHNPDFIASDGLHPSGKEYEKWAKVLDAAIDWKG